MNCIYDDGAAYGPDSHAQFPTDAPADPIYDDGDTYGADRAPSSKETDDEQPG